MASPGPRPRSGPAAPARARGSAWRGDELWQRADARLRLDDADVAELRAAARAMSAVPLSAPTASAFVLPRLAPRLARLQADLEHASGVTLVSGLPGGLPDDELARIFWGVACHVGVPVSQSASGERLLHVRDEGFERGDARVRGPLTNRRLSFHTDRCDVIAFLCVQPALTGGENDVLSSIALREELRRRHPDDLHVLEEDFVYLRHTVDPGNERPFCRQPVFSFHEGCFAASFLRVLIDRADAAADAPDLTAAQRTALDRLEAVAEDPALFVRFRLRAGDMLFLNNWITFHRRTAFEDHPDREQRRHLMRLWLSVPNSRPLDPRFRENFGATEAGAIRGGIHPPAG